MRILWIILGMLMVIGGASCSEKERKQEMPLKKERVDVTGFEKFKAFNVVDMSGICKLTDVADTPFVYVRNLGDTIDIVLSSDPDSLYRAVNHGDYWHLRVNYYTNYPKNRMCKCIYARPAQFDWYSFRDTTMLLLREPSSSEKLFVYLNSKYYEISLRWIDTESPKHLNEFDYLHRIAKNITSSETSSSPNRIFHFTDGRYYNYKQKRVREYFQTIDDFRNHDLVDSLPSIISAPELGGQRMPHN